MTFLNFIKNPMFLIVISMLFLVIGMLFSKNKMFDCKEIVKMHLMCFKKKSTGKQSYYAIFIAFVIPATLAVALVMIRRLDDSVINILTIIISILTGMFFTLLTMVLDMKKKADTDSEIPAREAKVTGKLLKEVYYSLMFEILISIIILILCFIELFAKQYSVVSSGIIYYLTLVLIFNLLIVLKRVFVVIKNDIED